jgi:hypothetical protein
MIHKVILHGADAEPTTPNQTEEATSVITALSGYTHIDMPTLEVDEGVLGEGDALNYIDGEVESLPHTRLVYNLRLFPMAYSLNSAEAYWYASEERNLRAVLAKAYKWLEFTTFASELNASISYHSSAHAIPVSWRGISRTSSDGTKRITLQMYRRYRSS